jgi:5-methylthioadenosine/S-adenosylhomocysteine deaminase
MLDRGVSVSLGADGAPCNNRLDMFTEMRIAALLQKVLRGSRALPALTALRMATTDAARALGLADQIGSVEVGKRADLQLINLNHLHTTPRPDPISTIVYAAEADDVDTVIIDGQIVMRERRLLTFNEEDVITLAREQARVFWDSLAPH